MVDSNRTTNPLTGRQWDLNSLLEKLYELQDALIQTQAKLYEMQDNLVQSQEKNISLSAQIRELERLNKDAEDIRIEHDNQAQLLADKTRENKYLHQELSRMSTVMNGRLQESEDLKAAIIDVQEQLKRCQSERDILAVMLTEAESAVKQGGRGETSPKDTQTNWIKYLKGK